MEIATISGIHHDVQPPTTPAKCDLKVCQNLTIINNTTESTITTLALVHKEDILQKDITLDNESLAITLNISKNVEQATPAVLPTVSNNSKVVRLKTSDKLTKVIETCKKLQKLSDQNANKKYCEAVLDPVSAGVHSIKKENSATALTEVSPTEPELSVNLPRLTPDELSILSDHAESHSSSGSSFNSFDLSHSTDSPISGSQHPSESNLKRFLFLFRPSDHEVLVRNKGVNMYRCNVCGGMYRQKFSLKRHFLRSHINFQYISQSDISNCKIAVPNDYVPQDMNIESDKIPHSRKKFKSSNAIFFENNEARVMPGLYTCHICVGVNFDLEQELRDHYDTHSDAERKKFQCDKCSASFFKKQILSRHLASHGERVVHKECRRCGAEFSSKSEYQKHLISHSSGRVCKYCSKILSTSANRKRHEALHLGLKPYRCAHCGTCFAQSKDLDRHLRKQHSGICHFCESCNKLFPSQASLDVHLHEKHSDPSPTKKIENVSSPELVNKPIVSSPEPAPLEAPIKLKVCIVCKRSFPTFYAMMKHRTQAHPYYTKRRRRKTMKQKLAQQAAAQEGIKVRKPYRKRVKHNYTFPTSTVRRGRPPLDRSVKFGAPSYRPGSRWMTKRDREIARKEEIEFYFSLSEKIAENLLHYVDGKTPQLSLKAYCFDERYPPCNFEERGRFPWSNYNFPIGYDVDKALSTRGQEVRNKMPENLSNRDKCLYATGLNSVQKLSEMSKNAASNNLTESSTNILETVRIQVNGIDIKKLDLEERKKLIGKKIPIVCLCYVCKENFESNETFEEHCVNNHPNVDCSCIEIEGNTDTPPVIPGDLCKQNVTADGIFFSWNVPPPLSETSLLKCTKCKCDFKSSLELHSHIIKCGNLRSSPSHIWKFNGQKRIKRTMKNRMSLAQQQATLDAHNKNYKTPEKFSYEKKEKISKSNEKVSKTTEKSQFYKSGRLQTTTSFTVDMNYFKTKPVKPANTQPSKRGRKSYATLSYRYKNASMQSTSIQCTHCKEMFNSQSALNIHLQKCYLNSQSKVTEKVQPVAGPVTSKAILNVFHAHTAGLANKFKSFQGSDKLENNSTKSSLPLSNTKKSLQIEKSLENNSSSKYKNTLNVDVRKSNMLENAMDLSINSHVTSSLTIDLSHVRSNNTSRKSALEIAMTAVQEYSQTSEQNEHISNLQMTVEKLNSPHAAALSPAIMSVSGKKVGRPKKVKRLGPLKFRKNLFPDSITNNNTATSKPASEFSESIANKDATPSNFPESNATDDTSIFPESIAKKDATYSKPTSESINNKDATSSKFPELIANKDTTISKPESIANKDANPSNLTSKFPESIAKKDAFPSKPALNITESYAKEDAIPSKPALNITESIAKKDDTTSKPASKLEEAVKRLTENKVKPDPAHSKETTSAFKTVGASKMNISGIESNTLSKLSSIQSAHIPVKIVNKDIVKIPISTSFSPNANLNLSTTGNFVPILIYGDKNKPINVLRLTNSQNIKSISLNQTISKNSNENSSLTNVNKASENSSNVKNSSIPEKTQRHGGDTNAANNSNLNSPSKKGDETRRTSGCQGRISPSLESIVNSIKQKLHSQESSPQDDVAISWLEDEKFEIPSRQKLVLPTDSGSNSPLSVDETFIPICADSSQPSDHEKSSSMILKQTTQVITQNAVETLPNPLQNIESSHDCPTVAVEPKTDEISVNCDTKILSPKKIPKKENGFPNNTTEAQNAAPAVTDELKNIPTSKIKQRRKRPRLFTIRKTRTVKTNIQKAESIRKKPGRPKRKNLDINTDTPDSDFNRNVGTSNESQPKTEFEDSSFTRDTVPTAENVTLQSHKTELKDQISEQNINLNDSKSLSSSEKTAVTKTEVSTDCHKESCMTTVENNELLKLSGSSTDITNVQSEDSMVDSKMSNLRAFRTKVKQLISPSSETSPSAETPTTTEFGRSLASRMKEKMRLSFENASLENLVKSDEGINIDIPDPSVSDTNSQVSDDDSEYFRAIKKEMESSEPTKKHSCPFCKLEFAYLTNFRRHLKLCRSRNLIKEVEPVPSTSTPVLQYLPKKDEVEHSMLNLLRHQSRQTQMLKEAEKKTGSTIENNFRSYSCNVCHRIYLSLFKLLQHQVTHKLGPKHSLQQNAELDYAKAMENYSVSDLEERGLPETEISKDIGGNNAEIMVRTEAEKLLSEEKLEIEKEQASVAKNETEENIVCLPVDNVKNQSFVSIESQEQNIITKVDSSEIPGDIKVSVKVEEQPAKRKRGRPLGWRKDASITPDTQSQKPVRSFRGYNKTNSVLLGIKKKKLNPSALKRGRNKFILIKSNIKAGENTFNRKNKIISLKQFEFTADDELPPIPVPLNETAGSKLLDSKSSALEDHSTNPNKQKQKNIFKRTYKKKIAITNTTLEDIKPVLPKIPQKLLTKMLPNPSSQKTNLEMKRSKSRTPVSVKTEPIAVEAKLPLKRKPGRPPRNLEAIPSTSKSRGFSQSGSSRNCRKMISRAITIYSSDSDDEGEQTEVNSKKKIMHLKPCPICKEKFSASLVLNRHIQLVHTRRSNPNAVKVASTENLKASKKVSGKSPVSNYFEDESKILKRSSPKAIVKSEKEDLKTPKTVDIRSPVTPEQLSAGKSKVSKRSPKVISISPSGNSPKAPKRGSAKYSTDDLSDFDCSGISKKDDKSNISIQSNKVDSPKRFRKNFAATNVISSKSSKKVAKSILDDNSDADSTKGTNKKDINTNVKRGKVAQKVFAKPVVDSNSDNDSISSFKQGINSNSPRFVRRIAAKSVGAKSLKIGSIVSKSPREIKRGTAKSITDDSSDVDSMKSVIGFNSPKTVKKMGAKLLIEDNSDSDSIKSFTPQSVKRTVVSAYSSDSEGVFRKAAAKSIAVSHSDAEIPKGRRKAITKFIPIDNSDCDSDISVKTDVTPCRNLKACSICKQNFPGALHLCRHMKLMHSSGEQSIIDNPDKIASRISKVCPICQESFSGGAFHLRRHINSMHSSDADSDVSAKTDASPVRHYGICPICKQKFSTKSDLCRHMQLLHSRKSDPGLVNSSTSPEPVTTLSNKPRSSMGTVLDNTASRGALSRHCRKPLPPLKRKWSKKDQPCQEETKI